MSKIVIPPPNAVNESWNEFTAPVEVNVVELAKSADNGTPIRTSLPSIAEPASCGARPGCAVSTQVSRPTEAAQRMPITPAIA